MKTGSKIVIAVALAILILTGQVLAAKDPPRYGRGPNQVPNRGAPDRLNLSPPGQPQQPNMLSSPAGPNQKMNLKLVMKKLDLTKEQRGQIKDIIRSNKKECKNTNNAVRDATKALHDAVVNSAGEADIRASAAALGHAIGDRAVLRAKLLASIKQVLTPDQLEKLERFKNQPFRQRIGLGGPNFGPGQGPGLGLGQGPSGPGGGLRFGPGPGPNGPMGGARFGQGPGRPNAPGMNPPRIFERIDTNSDGMLTDNEFEAANRPWRALKQMFDQADTNKDGALTIEELNAFRAGLNDRPRPQR